MCGGGGGREGAVGAVLVVVRRGEVWVLMLMGVGLLVVLHVVCEEGGCGCVGGSAVLQRLLWLLLLLLLLRHQ